MSAWNNLAELYREQGRVGEIEPLYKRSLAIAESAYGPEHPAVGTVLHGWKVSVLAQTGLSFDLNTASGKLMRTIMAGLSEFERDLIRERVKSGLASLGRAASSSAGSWVSGRQIRRLRRFSPFTKMGCPTG